MADADPSQLVDDEVEDVQESPEEEPAYQARAQRPGKQARREPKGSVIGMGKLPNFWGKYLTSFGSPLSSEAARRQVLYVNKGIGWLIGSETELRATDQDVAVTADAWQDITNYIPPLRLVGYVTPIPVFIGGEASIIRRLLEGCPEGTWGAERRDQAAQRRMERGQSQARPYVVPEQNQQGQRRVG